MINNDDRRSTSSNEDLAKSIKDELKQQGYKVERIRFITNRRTVGRPPHSRDESELSKIEIKIKNKVGNVAKIRDDLTFYFK